MKQLPRGVTYWIYYPPPRFAQGYIYKRVKERTYGCWATAAEMIVKWRNESALFNRPSFESLVETGDDFNRKVAYLDYVDKCLSDWGFKLVPGSMTLDWDTTLLASTLKDYGPLYCVGSFWASGEHNSAVGGLQHAIAVFGAQDDIVYYRDPWDGDIKKMGIKEFGKKLLRSSPKNMYRLGPHKRG